MGAGATFITFSRESSPTSAASLKRKMQQQQQQQHFPPAPSSAANGKASANLHLEAMDSEDPSLFYNLQRTNL